MGATSREKVGVASAIRAGARMASPKPPNTSDFRICPPSPSRRYAYITHYTSRLGPSLHSGAGTSFLLVLASSGCGLVRVVYDVDPLRVGRDRGVVIVVPVPPS